MKSKRLCLQSKHSEDSLPQKDAEIKKRKYDYDTLKQETIPLHVHHRALKSVREQACKVLLDSEGREERLKKKKKELIEKLEGQKKSIKELKEDKA